MKFTGYLKTIFLVAVVTLTATLKAQNLDEAKKEFNAGLNAYQASDYEAAVASFEKVVDICASLVENYEDADAEDLMYQTLDKIPGIYINISVNALKEKDVKKGIEYAEKAKKAADEYGDTDSFEKAKDILANVYTKLGGMKIKKGEIDGAIKDLDKATSEVESYASAYLYKALAYKEKEDHEAVKENALKAIEYATTPSDRKVKGQAISLGQKYFLKLGNDAKEAKNYAEAEKYLLNSLEFNSADEVTIRLLFEVYDGLGNYEKAVEYGTRAAESATENDIKSKIYYDLGKLYQGKGKNAEACDAYSKAQIGAYAENAKYIMEQELKCE